MSGNNQKLEFMVEEITPAQAEAYLAINMESNRHLSDHRVASIAAAIRRGEWKLNGQAIQFSSSGALVDGQHRLAAIVRSGRSVPCAVVRGVAPSAISTLDCGRSRSLSDVLALDGYRNCHSLAATLTLIHSWESGTLSVVGGGRARRTPAEILSVARRHPEVEEHIGALYFHPNILRPFRRAYAVFARWAMFQANATQARRFWQVIESGVADEKYPIALRVRERILRECMGTRNFVRDGTLLALMIKAWNATMLGEDLRVLKFGEEEEFPSVFGLPSPAKKK